MSVRGSNMWLRRVRRPAVVAGATQGVMAGRPQWRSMLSGQADTLTDPGSAGGNYDGDDKRADPGMGASQAFDERFTWLYILVMLLLIGVSTVYVAMLPDDDNLPVAWIVTVAVFTVITVLTSVFVRNCFKQTLVDFLQVEWVPVSHSYREGTGQQAGNRNLASRSLLMPRITEYDLVPPF